LYGGVSRRQAAELAAPFLVINAFVLLTPPWVFSQLNNAFQLYTVFILGMVFAIIFSAWREKTPGAGVVLMGFFLLGTTAASGIFFSNDRIQGGAITPLAFLEYYRVNLFQRYSMSLSTLSYIFTLLFVGIFGFAYFFRNPSVLRQRPEGEPRPDPLSLSKAGERFGLSAREIEVARLLLEGKPNKEISDVLCISLSTVKTHISRVFRKIGVDSRSELFHRLRQAAPEPPPESDGTPGTG